MSENNYCDETIEREIWTRSYLRALDVISPEAAAAVAEDAIAIYGARWRRASSSASAQVMGNEALYENSVLGARLVSSVRYRVR